QTRDFRDAILQHFSKYPQLSGSKPHVSGVRVTIDRSNPAGPQITSFQDESGKELDLDAWVLVATTKFVAGGGDGCTAWLRGEVIRVGDKVSQVVADFMMKKRLLSYPEFEGRITVTD
ncbi:TPA: hypothetical protein N0F65_005121, partial [Lagenidium giganteum]